MSFKSLISSTLIVTFTLLLSIINIAKAEEQTLATVSSDETKTTYKLVVDSVDGRTIKSFFKDVYENNSRIRRELLDANVIVKNGMILEQRNDHVVMKLKSQDFDREQGGIVIVDTLYNGATGERRSYEIQLAQHRTGWSLFKEGKSIRDIMIQTNRVMLIGAVGIKNLVMK